MATATREVNCVNCFESYEVEVNYTVEDDTNPIDPFQRKKMFVVVWEVIPTTCPHCHYESGEAFEKQLEEEIKEDIIKDAQN